MDIRGKLASLVKVAKKVREDGHSGTNDLNGNMVSRPDDLDVSGNVKNVKNNACIGCFDGTYAQNHASWKDEAKRESHQQDVNP